MSETLSLPPVAKSFYTFCKKCDIDRYHKVLAHTTATTAKIECEVCHSKKSYSLPKAGTEARRAKATAAKTSARKTSHTGEYELRNQKQQNSEALVFSVKTQYKDNQKISHPKFGIGFVQKAHLDKIEVIFSDELKSLVHNRT
jgi:hypothetical protein